MADPQTATVGLYAPSHASYTGNWDSPTNNNWAAVDALLGNVATVSLTGLTTLNFSSSNPIPNTGSSWAGPYPQQSAIIKFTGTLAANCTVTLPRAGFYLIHNTVTLNSGAVVILSGGAGNVIGMPPGEACHVYSDGSNMTYVNMGRVGSAFDLHGATAIPGWITACTVKPYLLKDGTLYNINTYPSLFAYLGTAFGGDGVTTFGVPDERARMRIPLDTNPGTGFSNRLTVASGQNINGQTMGSAGGEQVHTLVVNEIPSHKHTLTDPGHSHTYTGPGTKELNSGGGFTNQDTSTNTGTSFTGITMANTGGGAAHNIVQPGIVSFLPLIKT